MNHMVNLFGDTFNKKGVTAPTGLNLKYVRADYRDNLQINSKYERPLMVSEKEWNVLMDDAKEKELRKKERPGQSVQEGMSHIIFSMKNVQYFFLLLNKFKLRYLTYLKPFIGSPTPLKRQRKG